MDAQCYWASRNLSTLEPRHQAIYWQGRSFSDGQPKWVNQRKATRENIVFRASPEPTTDGIVLVEDIISAIKVNRVMDAIALLGSYISDSLVIDLSKQYGTVYIWLDADKAAYSLARTTRYRAFGLPVKRIYTKEDPKAYAESPIARIFENDTTPLATVA